MSSSQSTRKSEHTLNPILADGIFRVGGSLNISPLVFARRHPSISLDDHQVTRFVVETQYRKIGHLWSALKMRCMSKYVRFL